MRQTPDHSGPRTPWKDFAFSPKDNGKATKEFYTVAELGDHDSNSGER